MAELAKRFDKGYKHSLNSRIIAKLILYKNAVEWYIYRRNCLIHTKKIY